MIIRYYIWIVEKQHDITVGNNGYNDIPGYDATPGWGSPRTSGLLPALIKAIG